MGRNYYFLVSSLVDYSFDTDAKGLKLVRLRNEIAQMLSREDRLSMSMLYYFYDVQNIISVYDGRGENFSPLGNLSKEEIEQLVDYISQKRGQFDSDEDELPVVPKFITNVIKRFKEGEEKDTQENNEDDYIPDGFENSLWESFYDAMIGSKDKFLSSWYTFDREQRNISAAYTAREKSINIEEVVIGRDATAQQLIKSTLPDFGLKSEIDYLEPLFNVLDTTNIVEKERKLDLLRWEKIDEMTTFEYFSSSFVLGYMLKLNIIYRWLSLDKTKGKEFFEKLIKKLTSNELINR